ALPAEGLLEAQGKLAGQLSGGLPLTPVVDGVVLPEPPIDAIGKGQAAGVAVLVGTTRDEWRLFAMLDPSANDLDDEKLGRRLATLLADPARADEVVAHYRGRNADTSARDIWSDVGTDLVFRIPAVRLAERQSALGNDVW